MNLSCPVVKLFVATEEQAEAAQAAFQLVLDSYKDLGVPHLIRRPPTISPPSEVTPMWGVSMRVTYLKEKNHGMD